MPDTITIEQSLSVSHGDVGLKLSTGKLSLQQAGNIIASGVVSLTTEPAPIDVHAMDIPGWLYFRNVGASGIARVGVMDGVEFKQFGYASPGLMGFMRLAAAEPHAKSDAGVVDMEYWCIEEHNDYNQSSSSSSESSASSSSASSRSSSTGSSVSSASSVSSVSSPSSPSSLGTSSSSMSESSGLLAEEYTIYGASYVDANINGSYTRNGEYWNGYPVFANGTNGSYKMFWQHYGIWRGWTINPTLVDEEDTVAFNNAGGGSHAYDPASADWVELPGSAVGEMVASDHSSSSASSPSSASSLSSPSSATSGA